MAIIIKKQSDLSIHLLESGKMITLPAGTTSEDDIPVLEVSDTTWAKFVTAYGASA